MLGAASRKPWTVRHQGVAPAEHHAMLRLVTSVEAAP
jgi:hypothetical protein